MMKRFCPSVHALILVFSCFSFNQCLTGIYLSEQVFGTESTDMDQALLLGILSQNSSAGSNSSPTSGSSEIDYETEILDTESRPRVATPALSLSPGVFSSPESISINSETVNSEIYYTMDGNEPQPGASNTSLYEQPLSISSIAGLTIRAKAIKGNYEESEETTGLYSLRILRTGQNNSFQTGDDGDLQPGGNSVVSPPVQDQTYTNDYTTTDNYTGLVWKTCREGRSGAACSSGETNFTLSWHQAVNSCNNLNSQNNGNGYAGRRDWRLPEFRELESLYIYSMGGNPSLSPVSFPNANQGSSFVFRYWTNTLSNRFGNDYAMDLEFRGNIFGSVFFGSSQFDSGGLVRCVAGTSHALETPIFVDNGDGTIHDKTSGLTWTQCARLQDNNNNCSGNSGAVIWTGAFDHCNQLTLDNFAGKSWRVPTIRELITLFRPESLSQPRTYSEFFPNTLQVYWSSTTRASDTNQAWTIQFNDGRVNTMAKTTVGVGRVRCVAMD